MKESFRFLTKFGQFQRADRSIPDNSFAVLQSLYQREVNRHHPQKARQIALKLTVQHGLEGLYFYAASEMDAIKKDKKHHEIIDQSAIQLLGLIFFIEKYVSDIDTVEMHQLEEQKNTCLELFDRKALPVIEKEAQALGEYYYRSC